MEYCLWSDETGDVRSFADGENLASTDCDGFDGLRLVFGKAFAGVDDAVEEDDVGSAGDAHHVPVGWGIRVPSGLASVSGLSGAQDGCGYGRSGERWKNHGANCAHGRSVRDFFRFRELRERVRLIAHASQIGIRLLLSGPFGHEGGEQQNAAETEFTVLVAVPLGEGVGTAAVAACSNRERRNAEGERNVGVG